MRFTSIAMLVALSLTAVSCATGNGAKARVEAKLAAQQVTEADATKPSPIEDIIKTNEKLTPDDKQELLKVVEEAREKNRLNLIERVKIRNVLIQEMSQGYDSEEVKILKRKFVNNFKTRVHNMFYVMDRFEQILKGHDQKDKILQHALHNEMLMSTINTK